MACSIQVVLAGNLEEWYTIFFVLRKQMNLFRSDIGINLASNVLLALLQNQSYEPFVLNKYSVILSVVDPRKFEYLKDY